MGEFTIHEGDNGTCTYGAKLGCFDDRVISMAIALEMLHTNPKMRDKRNQAIAKKKKVSGWKPAYESEETVIARSKNNYAGD